MIKILFIGDVFGSIGRVVLSKYLKHIKEKENIDFVICNIENANKKGKGVSPTEMKKLWKLGIDCYTFGNHTFAKKEIVSVFADEKYKNNVISPGNLKKEHPFYGKSGNWTTVFECKGLKIRVSNLLGSTVEFKKLQTNPFVFLDEFLKKNKDEKEFHILDFHAETTSEKNAFLRAFDGKIQAILGTHTHVPSNDYQVTKNNTAYITDVGMTGPFEGIIGGEVEPILKSFYDPTFKFILDQQQGSSQLCSVILEVNEETSKIEDFYPLILREEDFSAKAKLKNFKEYIQD